MISVGKALKKGKIGKSRPTFLLKSVCAGLLFTFVLSACASGTNPVRSDDTKVSDSAFGSTAASGSVQSDGTENPSTEPTPTAQGALPILSLTTETGEDVDPRDGNKYYIGGTLSLSGCDETDVRTDLPLQIRGRGNYSWTSCPKKSYRIKLENSEKLLGLGEGKSKTWCLLANYVDQSLMRNQLSFRLAEGLSGLAWSPDAASVELWLNGEYRGIYLLVEAIKVDEHRVNVTVDDSEDTGFLLQMTHNSDETYRFSVFGVNYDVKSDLSVDSSTASLQLDAIRSRVEACFFAVLGGDEEEVRALIDLDSLIDCYLLEEFNKNLDVGWDSFYLSCDKGGKLTFGPVWDFDLAFGNASSNGASLPEGLYAAVDFGNDIHTNYWFTLLCEQDWFLHAVADRWSDPAVQTLFAGAGEYVREQMQLYGAQYEKNFEIWDIFINRGPAALRELESFWEHAEYLADWADMRIEWMNEFIGSEAYYIGEVG